MEEEVQNAKQAMQTLKERLQEQSFLPTPLSTDEEFLSNYLQKTQDIEMPDSHRLIAFAEFMSGKLTWQQFCEVFEFILKSESPDEHNGTYAVWISKSEDLLSRDTISESERTKIAGDLVSIFDRALSDTPQNAGLALGLGTNYLKEATRREGDTEFISQAVTWLNRAMDWLPAPNKQDHIQKYICANINLRLGQCYMLLRVYKLALEHLNAASNGNLLGGQEFAELSAGIDRCTLELGTRE